jgi:hypothetical protein
MLHNVEVKGGVLELECKELMRDFFNAVAPKRRTAIPRKTEKYISAPFKRKPPDTISGLRCAPLLLHGLYVIIYG